MIAESLIGRRFGRLKVIGLRSDGRRILAVCRCDCGGQKETRKDRLTSGVTASCGCLQLERAAAGKTIHGATVGRTRGGRATPEFSSWAEMKKRCSNPKVKGYQNYGGRGITVCERWVHDFRAFLADMGRRPRDTSIDRWPNPDGNYEPGNCRWATRKEQRANRRHQP